MAISTSETTTKPSIEADSQSVKCHSCGFVEECTPAYISRVRDRYQGKWLCGLCVEAVKDEVLRSDKLISTEEALDRHISFCDRFKSLSLDEQETENPISVMGRVLIRRSSNVNSPRRTRPIRTSSSAALSDVQKVHGSSPLFRSESCFSALKL